MKTLTKTVTKPTVNPFTSLIAELRANKGCRFVQLLYTAKGTGEVAKHTLAMGVNLERAYRRDEKIISNLRPNTDLGKEAKAAVLASVRKSLEVGIGNNPAYTNKGVYEDICPGFKYHVDTLELYVTGFVVRKNVVKPGVRKTVNSAPLTIEKEKINKKRKMGRFRQFIIRNIAKATLNGVTLELEAI